MSLDELLALLRARRSVRTFRAEPPPRALVEQLLEAAVLAPSASNAQPWRFVVVSRRETIERLEAGVRDAVERIALAVEPAAVASYRAYGEYFTRFAAAPLVVAVLHRRLSILSNLVGPSLAPDDLRRIDRLEASSGAIGASLALGNLLLAAQAAGLGASGMTGPLVGEDVLRRELAVPEGWELLALVPIGYPAEAPAATERKPAGRVTRWIE